jgi:hypothetical protein
VHAKECIMEVLSRLELMIRLYYRPMCSSPAESREGRNEVKLKKIKCTTSRLNVCTLTETVSLGVYRELLQGLRKKSRPPRSEHSTPSAVVNPRRRSATQPIITHLLSLSPCATRFTAEILCDCYLTASPVHIPHPSIPATPSPCPSFSPQRGARLQPSLAFLRAHFRQAVPLNLHE